MPITKDVFQRNVKVFFNAIKQNELVASQDNVVATIPKGEIVFKVIVDIKTAGTGTMTVKLGSTTLGSINTGTAGATVYNMCTVASNNIDVTVNPTNANIACNIAIFEILPNGERVFV